MSKRISIEAAVGTLLASDGAREAEALLRANAMRLRHSTPAKRMLNDLLGGEHGFFKARKVEIAHVDRWIRDGWLVESLALLSGTELGGSDIGGEWSALLGELLAPVPIDAEDVFMEMHRHLVSGGATLALGLMDERAREATAMPSWAKRRHELLRWMLLDNAQTAPSATANVSSGTSALALVLKAGIERRHLDVVRAEVTGFLRTHPGHRGADLVAGELDKLIRATSVLDVDQDVNRTVPMSAIDGAAMHLRMCNFRNARACLERVAKQSKGSAANELLRSLEIVEAGLGGEIDKYLEADEELLETGDYPSFAATPEDSTQRQLVAPLMGDFSADPAAFLGHTPTDNDDAMRKGERFIAQGRIADAQRIFEEVVGRDPQNAMAQARVAELQQLQAEEAAAPNKPGMKGIFRAQATEIDLTSAAKAAMEFAQQMKAEAPGPIQGKPVRSVSIPGPNSLKSTSPETPSSRGVRPSGIRRAKPRPEGESERKSTAPERPAMKRDQLRALYKSQVKQAPKLPSDVLPEAPAQAEVKPVEPKASQGRAEAPTPARPSAKPTSEERPRSGSRKLHPAKTEMDLGAAARAAKLAAADRMRASGLAAIPEAPAKPAPRSEPAPRSRPAPALRSQPAPARRATPPSRAPQPRSAAPAPKPAKPVGGPNQRAPERAPAELSATRPGNGPSPPTRQSAFPPPRDTPVAPSRRPPMQAQTPARFDPKATRQVGELPDLVRPPAKAPASKRPGTQRIGELPPARPVSTAPAPVTQTRVRPGSHQPPGPPTQGLSGEAPPSAVPPVSGERSVNKEPAFGRDVTVHRIVEIE